MTPRCLPDLKRRRLAALLGLVAGTAWAQPSDDTARPIRWIVPFPTGAIADVVARAIGAQLTIDTGQPVQIENRPGGNTALAALETARAPADGHTVLSADNGMWVFNPALYRSLSYSPSRDFTPVTQLVRLPMVLLVGPASGVRDARAFIEDARAFPGRFSFASAGNGSAQHLAMALLAREAGLEMVHVPYRSAGPALRYGTCTISSPASRASSSIARCCALPLPAEAKLKRPGKARASSMKARASRTPLAGPTSSTIGSRTSCVTGVKSRDGL